MEILLVGGKSYFINATIDKLNKEGHKVYVLSGNEYNKDVFPKAFEQFDFRYDNAFVKEVFESVRPDVVIFFGAYDPNFREGMEQEDVIYYSSGLMNILMNLSLLERKSRFIYLSYEKVFSRHSDRGYTEEDATQEVGSKAVAVRRGEIIATENFGSAQMTTCVLRLDHLYGKPEGIADAPEPVYQMCKEVNQFGVMGANSNHSYSMLYVDDAVDYLYQVVTAETMEHKLYNISSGCVMSEPDIADIVVKGVRGKASVESHSVGNPYLVSLSGERFAQEFRLKVFDKPEKNIAAVANHIYSHPKDFFEKKDEKKSLTNRILNKVLELFRLLVPYIEVALCFIPFFMLNNRATGSRYFSYLDFYLLYVLLFAVAFGQQQAVFAGILATAGFIFRQQYTQSVFSVILDYNTYVWIAQIFILGLVVGYLKDRLTGIKDEKDKEINYLKHKIRDIGVINSTNVDIKRVLETQLINQDDSLGKVYDITNTLDQYAPEEVLFYASEVVSKLIRSRDVAIYTVANGDYARLFTATSDQARTLGNSIKYTDMEDMYKELKEERIYINREMKDQYPLMADGIYSGENMELIIMVWGIPWDRMNLGQANMLKVIGFLIQKAVVTANKYMAALVDERYKPGTPILQAEAFTTLVKAYVNAINKNLTEASILRIENVDKPEDELAKELYSVLRNSDYLGKLADGNLYVLLSNTSNTNARFVIDRFKSMGYQSSLREDMEVS